MRSFIRSYEDALRQTKPSLLSQVTSPDCLRTTAPAAFVRSVGQDPAATMDNEVYAEHMAGQLAIMEDGRCVILSTCVDTAKKSAVARVEHHCKLPGKDSLCVEFCWFLDFTEDGKAIKKIVQFVDSQTIFKFMQMVQEAAASKGA